MQATQVYSAGKALEGAQLLSASSEALSSRSGAAPRVAVRCAAAEEARREKVERPPAWMMRQAGRYMKVYQELSKKHPSFRERSENTDLIVEITLQPWRAFAPDGVILFSDILTPLDAMGIPFEIDENKGPIIDSVIKTDADFKPLHDIDLEKLSFVGESLGLIRKEIGSTATLLGFVGAPWTLATYCVEGKTTRTYTAIKSMTYSAPAVLHKLLGFLAAQIGEYAKYQIEAGAQCIQLFDSWGGQLTPDDWETWSKPYIMQVVSAIKEAHPTVPVVLYANGSGGLLERMATVGTDVMGLDWQVDMADGRKRVGMDKAVQGNVDPAVLFASKDAITEAIHSFQKVPFLVRSVLFGAKDAIMEAIHSCVAKAGPTGHILNLGHGVLVGTPEENVAHFFSTVRSLSYENSKTLVNA